MLYKLQTPSLKLAPAWQLYKQHLQKEEPSGY